MDQQLITNLVVVGLVYLLVFLPRFNQWPADYGGSFSGRPSGYINDLTFLFFSLTYLATFIFLGFALSQIPNIQQYFPLIFGPGGQGQPIDPTILNSNFAIAVVMLVTALSIPIVDRADSRWRGYLLNLARIPREALALRAAIIDSIDGLDHSRIYTSNLSGDVRQTEQAAFWDRCLNEPDTDANELATRTLSGLYIIEQIRDLSPKSQDLEYLANQEKRFKEIATIIPTLGNSGNELSPAPYRDELDMELARLAEIYACYTVKKQPNATQRYRALNEAGFPVSRPKEQNGKLIMPVLLTGSVLLACCAVVTMLGLVLFDVTGFPGPPGRWFTMERIYDWTSGSWFSFVMAFGFGIFFNEILEPTLGRRSLMAYLLAFVFSTLSACAFFLFARETFQPHYLWLAINFGLLSAVTIATLKRTVSDQSEVLRLSMRLAVYYGLASVIFSVLVHLHAGVHAEEWTITPGSIATAAVFGLFRGAVIGFFVAYVFIEFGRVQQNSDRRRAERTHVGRRLKVALRDAQIPAYLKNLSDDGALLKVFSRSVSVGDEISLTVGSQRPQTGSIQWIEGNLAGVRFEHDHHSLSRAA
ncbi:PilZ domain-containing protein [Marinobacter sp. OP 3.4]|uniref:PilZ domain-containing protein n=1 Tax=Marinobacter sp. OP 3.4 TaxID=3076501 RepID=UPI002E20843D